MGLREEISRRRMFAIISHPDAGKTTLTEKFLLNGEAMRGLIDIVGKAGAELVGIGVAVEKGFQHGGDRLREAGYNLRSLAIIDGTEGGKITFRAG